jgi:hypothetical protein
LPDSTGSFENEGIHERGGSKSLGASESGMNLAQIANWGRQLAESPGFWE